MKKLFYTAADLAFLSLPGLPTTKRAINAYAQRYDWHNAPLKCRKREGHGGGNEFHISLLPAEAQNAIALRSLKNDSAVLEVTPETVFEPIQTAAGSGDLRRDAKMTILMVWNSFLRDSTDGVETAQFSFTTLYKAKKIAAVPKWVYQQIDSFSVSTLRNWLKARSNGQINALAGNYGNRKGTSILDTAYDGKVASFITSRVVNQPHLTGGHIRDLLRAEFGEPWEVEINGAIDLKPLPNIRNIQRWIKQWKDSHQEALIKVTDQDKYKNKYQPAPGKANAWVKAPNQLWEIDASPADVLLKDGRYNIYLVVDIFTRRIKVLVSKTPTTAASLLLIRQAIMDWGVPHMIRTDNGSDFISRQFRRALIQLDIVQETCAPFTPESKGTVERHIKTLQHGFMPLLPGFIGHNVTDRKKIEARRAFAKRLGEDDSKAFCVDLDHHELQELVNTWCDAKYAHTQHGGLNGTTPFEMAASYTGVIKRIENEAALHLLLAEAPGKEGFRTITKKGVRIGGLTYWGNGFQVGQRIYVRHDPEDLGRIFCFTEDDREFICTAINFEAEGINPAEAAKAARQEQKRRIREEVEPLQREIRRIGPRDMIDPILRDAVERSANVTPFPTRTENHTTQDLEAIKAAILKPSDEFEPRPEEVEKHKVAAQQRLRNQMQLQKRSDARNKEDPKRARFEKAVALEQWISEGRDVGLMDRKWLGNYQKGAEYKARKRIQEVEVNSQTVG